MHSSSIHKFHTRSRVQVLLGLCMAMCMIFLSGSHITKADNFYQYSWGSYDQDGNPFKIYNTTGLNIFDMISYLYGEDNTSGKYPSHMPDVRFYDAIYTLGLEPAFTFFDTSAPPFYINVYCYGSTGILLIFSKNNCFFSEENYSFTRNSNGNYIFSTGNNIIYSNPLDVNLPFIAYKTPQIICNSLSENGDTFRYFDRSTYPHDIWESNENSYISGGSIRSCKYYLGSFSSFQDISGYFSEWMSGDYNFLFVDVNCNANITYPYIHSIGFDCYCFNTGNQRSYLTSSTSIRYPILSTIYTYSINSDFTVLRSSYTHMLRCNEYDTDNPIGNILSYGIDRRTLGNLPTPIPYPTQYWYTLTPFPTVILQPTLTPIGFFGDTDIVINTGDLWGDIKGNLGIFNQWFATNPFPAFFAGVGDLIYSFNPLFKFLMVIPICALLAMVIGRLRRK